MDADALEKFCSDHLANLEVEGFSVNWDFPGCLTLTPVGGAPEDSDGCPLSLVVTPDFMNGDPDSLVVEIMFEGDARVLDLIPANWTGDVAADEKTWRDLVEKTRPTFQRAIELARDGINPVTHDDLGPAV